eukprot:scaffold14056_cov119-Isochrysis_galbana.AAC.2
MMRTTYVGTYVGYLYLRRLRRTYEPITYGTPWTRLAVSSYVVGSPPRFPLFRLHHTSPSTAPPFLFKHMCESDSWTRVKLLILGIGPINFLSNALEGGQRRRFAADRSRLFGKDDGPRGLAAQPSSYVSGGRTKWRSEQA